MELEITDPDTDITYTVILNDDEYYRALEDMSFATSLLNGLIKEAENSGKVVPETNSDFHETETEASCSTAADRSIDDSQQTSCISTSSNHNIHVWQYSETVAVIKSMQSHYEDLSHPKKKKHVFENCANDLLSSGYNVTATQCQLKWKSLIRSYTTAKDHKNKTGRGPSRFQFFDEMDAILGTKPSNRCEHAVESSSATEVEAAEVAEEQVMEQMEAVQNKNAKSHEVKQTPKKRKGMNYEEYVKEKKCIDAQKNNRHAERMAIEKQKLENDREKIALLKEYLAKK